MADFEPPEHPKPPLEDQRLEITDSATRREAVATAFDYRGDVTLHLDDGRELVGYVFDRRFEPEPGTLRMMLTAGGRETVALDQLRAVVFSGRDTAAGKSWETWVRKYTQKKLAGEKASIEPESSS